MWGKKQGPQVWTWSSSQKTGREDISEFLAWQVIIIYVRHLHCYALLLLSRVPRVSHVLVSSWEYCHSSWLLLTLRSYWGWFYSSLWYLHARPECQEKSSLMLCITNPSTPPHFDLKLNILILGFPKPCFPLPTIPILPWEPLLTIQAHLQPLLLGPWYHLYSLYYFFFLVEIFNWDNYSFTCSFKT